MTAHRATALIAGGGPAGAAAAILLARAGAKPLLIERSRPGDQREIVCGGFLGWDALARLDRLGIDAAALGAPPIDRLRLVARTRTVETPLPFRAVGLSRRTMDAALLAAAVAAGAGVERGTTIRRAAPGEVQVGGQRIAADSLFLASGKHELRGLGRGHRRGDAAVGLRVALDLPPAMRAALAGAIELHAFDGGYAGLLMQEDGLANLCFSVRESRFADAGGSLSGLLDSLARKAPRLADVAAFRRPGIASIAGVPYGWRGRETPAGLFRLGDQAAVISSIAGDGVAIALASAASAVAAWAAHGPAGAPLHQRRFAAATRAPLAVSGTARRIAETGWLRGPVTALLARTPLLTALVARATRIGA